MTKNKIVKWLKIIAVFGPLIFGYLSWFMTTLGYSNALSGQIGANETTDVVLNLLYNRIVEDGVNMLKAPVLSYISAFGMLSTSPTLSPLINGMTSFVENFTGLGLTDILTLWNTSELLSATAGYIIILSFMLIIWYLIVEIIFFIPEVLIMFVRWCKSLLYKFMDKGGFDT